MKLIAASILGALLTATGTLLSDALCEAVGGALLLIVTYRLLVVSRPNSQPSNRGN